MNQCLKAVTGMHIVEHELDSREARDKIDHLQTIVETMPQTMPELSHFFAKGLYARQGVIKKGTLLIGAIKRFSHVNIISGDISIFTAEGEIRITGQQCVMVAAPGTKRVGYAHEDTAWTTIISTDETDVSKIEKEVLAQTYEDYVSYCNQLQNEEG